MEEVARNCEDPSGVRPFGWWCNTTETSTRRPTTSRRSNAATTITMATAAMAIISAGDPANLRLPSPPYTVESDQQSDRPVAHGTTVDLRGGRRPEKSKMGPRWAPGQVRSILGGGERPTPHGPG